MVTQEQQKRIIETYIRAYNTFDVESMAANMTDDVHYQNIAGNEVNQISKGKEAFKKNEKEARQFFISRKKEITNWRFNEDEVTVEVEANAQMNTNLPNGIKAGHPLNDKGTINFQFDGNQIAKVEDRVG